MEELRKATGLTQQQLADYTLVNRTAVSMFEIGLRPMPTPAMQQLTELFLLLPPNTNAENIPLVTDELTQQTLDANKAVENYKRECSLKLHRKQKQLKQLEINYAQCITLLQGLRSLRQRLPQNEENSYRHTWLRVAEQETIERLATCSLAKQQVLQLEIEQLQTLPFISLPLA
jgi:transcriptional regulator with XRE-family HTH domain